MRRTVLDTFSVQSKYALIIFLYASVICDSILAFEIYCFNNLLKGFLFFNRNHRFYYAPGEYYEQYNTFYKVDS